MREKFASTTVFAHPEKHPVVVRCCARADLFLRPSILPIKRVRSVGAAGVVEAQRAQAQRLAAPLVLGQRRIGKVILLESSRVGAIGLGRVSHLLRRARGHPSGKGLRQQRLGNGRKHQVRRALRSAPWPARSAPDQPPRSQPAPPKKPESKSIASRKLPSSGYTLLPSPVATEAPLYLDTDLLKRYRVVRLAVSVNESAVDQFHIDEVINLHFRISTS